MVTENLARRAVPSSPDATVCVMAAHGIVAKYRSVASASWQRDTSTTSKGGDDPVCWGTMGLLFGMELGEQRGEVLAGRAPVCAEIKANHSLAPHNFFGCGEQGCWQGTLQVMDGDVRPQQMGPVACLWCYPDHHAWGGREGV